jgi:hypothetical protein
MVIEIDRTKLEAPRDRLPPRRHSAEKQLAIRTQINKLLELGVIEESQAINPQFCPAQCCDEGP